ncbi:MAG: hypothetical protein V3W28_01105, partial [Thermoplasmata archaeon]
MTATFWEWMLQFHEHAHTDYPNGEEGLKAVRSLRDLLDPVWQGDLHDHALRNRVGMASRRTYESLGQYARKLDAAADMPGFRSLVPRLGHPGQYLGAMHEIETALRLRLEGYEVRFLRPSSSKASPDLLVQSDHGSFAVEVGSLNRPDQEGRINDVFSRILGASIGRAVLGGVIIGAPLSARKASELVSLVETAIDSATRDHEVVTVNIPGVATVYVAPRDLASSLPEEFRGSFRFIPPYERRAEERVARRLREKAKQVLQLKGPGLVVLYDNLLGSESLRELLESPKDDIAAVLTSFPQILGLMVVTPLHMIHNPKQEHQQLDDHRTRVVAEVGIDEWEMIGIWKNLH